MWGGGEWQEEYREKHNVKLCNRGWEMGGKDDSWDWQPQRGGAPWQEKLNVYKRVAEGENTKGTQKSKLSPILRKLLLHTP